MPLFLYKPMKITISNISYKFILIASILITTGLLCAIPALAADMSQQNDWIGTLIPYLIVIAFITIVIFFPVFAGFLSATAGLIILGLIVLLLGSCFTSGISWGNGHNMSEIFIILLSHFYIYIGIVLIILDLAMLGSVIISVIGVGFIVWDIGSSVWHGGQPTWGETDLIVFGVLMSITLIAAFIYSLRKTNKKPVITHLPIGKIGAVTEIKPDRTYKIQINHELWDAVSTDELAVGDDVEVLSIRDLTLTIRKM